MAVPGRAQPADRRRPGRAVTPRHRASGTRRRPPRRYRAGAGPGPAARLWRPVAPVARTPDGAGGNLLPRRYDRNRRPPARDPARHSQITAALRPAGAPPAAASPRRRRSLMTSRPPRDVPGADADGGTTLPAAGLRPGRHLITVMLLAAAALDLARCGIVLATARHAAPAIGLVAAGLAAAALSVRTARGCQSGRRWSAWAAVLIGAASAPQAAASGFHSP